MFPKLKKQFIDWVMSKDPNLASWMSQEVKRVATAPPRDWMTYNTIDSYMEERLRDAAMKSVHPDIETACKIV